MNKIIISLVVALLAITNVYAGVYLSFKKDPFSESYIARVRFSPEVLSGKLDSKESLYIRELTKDKKVNSVFYVQLFAKDEKYLLDKDADIITDKERFKVEINKRRLTKEAYYPTLDGEIVLSAKEDNIIKNATTLHLLLTCNGEEIKVRLCPEDLFKIKTAINTIKATK